MAEAGDLRAVDEDIRERERPTIPERPIPVSDDCEVSLSRFGSGGRALVFVDQSSESVVALDRPGSRPGWWVGCLEPVGAGKSILGSCGELVFVDESSESVSAVHVRRVGGWSRDRAWERGWALIERSVWSVVVVVVEVRPAGRVRGGVG